MQLSALEKSLLGERPVYTQRPMRVFICVGEASGDEHAAGVVRSLKQKFPNAEFFGMGGKALRAEGMETVVDSETAAGVMGLTEVIGSLGRIIKAFRKLERTVAERRPDVVVLVDFPDFNLRLAKAVHRYCPRIVYFVSPQLWAWRRGRIKTVKRFIAKVIPIFPFEEPFYAEHGVEAKFVGHPFADREVVAPDRVEWMRLHGLDPDQPLLALLPGSRRAEIERLAPVIRDSVAKIRTQIPNLQAVIAVAQTLDPTWTREHFAGLEPVTFVPGAREVLSIADAAIVASGTATVEAAFCRMPMVVVYKLSGLTYVVGKALVRGVKFIAMPNLVAGKEIIRELLQGACTPDAVAAETVKILTDADYRATMRRNLAAVGDRLEYEHSTAERTVDRVAQLIAAEAGPEFRLSTQQTSASQTGSNRAE